MPRLRPAFVVLGVGVLLGATVASARWFAARREEGRLRAEWQAKVDCYRVQFGRGATRAEVEAALDRDGAARQSFSGGMPEPDESDYKDRVQIGTRANQLCGTVVYAYAIFVYRAVPSAGVFTGDPHEPFRRVYLEEDDSCGVI